MSKRKCAHCNTLADYLNVYVDTKLGGSFCSKCYNIWYEMRDKLVTDAFKDFIRQGDDSKR